MKKIILLTLGFLVMGTITFAQNLVLDAHFDGNLIDSSASNNDLVSFGGGTNFVYGAGATNAVADLSMVFTGGKGMVSSNAVNNGLWAGAAISVWVKDCMDGQLLQGAFLGFGASFDINGHIQVFFDGGSSNSLVSTVSLNDGAWHHIVAQNNGNTSYLYIDGQLDTLQVETLYNMPAPNSAAKLYLGLTSGNLNKLNGEIDELKLYDAALTQNEITALANENVFYFANNLALDCQFDGNLLDNSTSNNHFNSFGAGANFVYGAGATSNGTDSAMVFTGGKGLESTYAIDNSQWTGMAISVWVKDCVEGQLIQGAFLGFGASFDVNGHVQVFFDGNSANSLGSTISLNDGAWHHLFLQNNGHTTYLYIDGQLNASQTEPLSRLATPNPAAKLYLGLTFTDVNKLNGEIDNLKIYDGALIESDITILANNGTPVITSTASVLEVAKQKNINMYPNPTRGELILDNLEGNNQQLNIFNTTGQLVHSEILTTNSINIQNLTAGIYFVAIYNENKQLVASQQVIKK